MTCRVARSSQDHPRMDPAFCCECGSANLEVCRTSKTLGPHLCAMCTQSKVECSVVEFMMRSPRRDRVEACTGASLENERRPTEAGDRRNKEIVSAYRIRRIDI